MQPRDDVVARQYDGFYGAKSSMRLNTIDERTIDGRNLRKEMIDLIDVPPDGIVYDIGCSVGAQSLDLRQRRHHLGLIVGLDIDKSSLELASSDVTKKDLKSMVFMPGDLHNLPFADNSGDALFGSFSYHHALDIVAAIREAHRVLKPKGQLLVTANSLEQKSETDEILETYAKSKGIKPRKKFAEKFNTDTAPEILAGFFRSVQIIPQVSEVRFEADEFNDYLNPTGTYWSDFDPPIERTVDRLAATAALRKAFDEKIRSQGYFSETVNRAIYNCRKLD